MGSGSITYLLDLLTDLATSVHNFSTTSLFDSTLNYGPVFASLKTNVLNTSLHWHLDDADQTAVKG